jgi:hypothetical protein
MRIARSAVAVAAAAVSVIAAGTASGASGTLAVSGTQWGVSTCYIGGTEGNVRFDASDLVGAGMNTYRIYGGMSRWETADDDGVYGSPSIAEIKADPNRVNWAHWDAVMTSPPNGSDYDWSGTPGTVWQGNARTLFQGLKDNAIRPVLTIRNRDNNGNPAWSPNPPTTTADWNEWWEHVFATAYWLNVRNDYRVDEYEVHNEPDNRGQGWGGTQAQYFELVRFTKDAIDHVYRTYLPGRTYHIHAPVTKGGSDWPLAAMQQVPGEFDSVNIHNYSSDITSYTRAVHGWMNANGFAAAPLWLSEWATYRGRYDNVSTGVELVIKNLIRASRPGDDHIYGSHLFTFYDWDGFHGGFQNFEGLVDRTGARRASYFAMRMATRALQGCRPTYETISSISDVTAITTRDAIGSVYMLVTNSAPRATHTLTADLSPHKTTSTGTMWQFGSGTMDVVTGSPALSAGRVTFTIPGRSAVLLRF